MTVRDRLAGVASPGPDARIVVDRVACTGRGVCATILAPAVTTDEWGYPIVVEDRVDPELGAMAVRLCPVRAMRWRPSP